MFKRFSQVTEEMQTAIRAAFSEMADNDVDFYWHPCGPGRIIGRDNEAGKLVDFTY